RGGRRGRVQRRARAAARCHRRAGRVPQDGTRGQERRRGDRRARARLGHRVHRRGDPAFAQLLLDGRHRRAARRHRAVRRHGADRRARRAAEAAARMRRRRRRSVPPRAGRAAGRPGAGAGVRARARGRGGPRDTPAGGQMIRINLIPAEETERAAGRRRDLAVGTIALSVLAVAFVLAHVWQGVQLRMANRQLEWLTAEPKKIEGDYADVTKIEQQKTELREKLRVIAQLEAKKVGPVRILADLAAATPDKLWLTEFSDTAGALKLTGLGVDDHTVADFLR